MNPKKKTDFKKNLKETFFPRLSSKPSCPLWKAPTQYVEHELASLLIITPHSDACRKILVSPWEQIPPHTAWNPSVCAFVFFEITKFIHITKVVFGTSVCPSACLLSGWRSTANVWFSKKNLVDICQVFLLQYIKTRRNQASHSLSVMTHVQNIHDQGHTTLS